MCDVGVMWACDVCVCDACACACLSVCVCMRYVWAWAWAWGRGRTVWAWVCVTCDVGVRAHGGVRYVKRMWGYGAMEKTPKKGEGGQIF